MTACAYCKEELEPGEDVIKASYGTLKDLLGVTVFDDELREPQFTHAIGCPKDASLIINGRLSLEQIHERNNKIFPLKEVKDGSGTEH